VVRRHRSLFAVGASVALLALAGCGDDDDDSGDGGGGGGSNASESAKTEASGGGEGGGGGETLRISADPGGALKFDKSKLDARAGTVTISMDNPSSATAPHAVEVEGNGVEEEGDVVEPGQGKSTVTVDLEPGEYVFYCPVGNHEQAGMKGTLTVK
jgi:plastocyanin